MIIGGIDPGKSGALVTLDVQWDRDDDMGVYAFNVARVPIIKATKTRKAHPDWDQMFKDWSRLLSFCSHVLIEQVWGANTQGRQQGGAGMFNFGYVAGFPFGIVQAQRVPYTFMTPQKWKKLVGIPTGADKDASRELASELMPFYRESFKRKKDDGVAEAALIAYSGAKLLASQGLIKEGWEP